jgi:glycosyltransferase involved in cell wall biosynthesis
VNVLILHHHFKSPQRGGALRSYYLAKALVDRGIGTTVITTHNDPSYSLETIDGIQVHYLPIAYDNRFGFYQRSRSFLHYIYRSVQLAASLGPFDVCYAISVPLTTSLAALWLRSGRKLPYIFEVGDLWPDAPIQLGVIKNNFFKQMLYKLEKLSYRRAEFVVALSPAIQAAVERKVPGTRTELIPNMADTGFFKPEQKDPHLVERFGVKDKFVVSYIGALGFANGLDHILECARAAQRAELPVQFYLCGDGAMKTSLQQGVAQLGLRNLEILPFQNRDGVRELLNITDAVFICYRPLPVLETGSPNKYFDGLAAGKLIMINFGGWIREEIERERCGMYIETKNPSAFVSSIRPFLHDADLLRAYQGQARVLAERKYARHILSEKFAACITR